MNLSKNEIKLLSYLFKSNEHIPLKNILFELGLSDKTIRSMISNINSVLKDYDAVILLKRGQGYILRANDIVAIQDLIEVSQYSFSEQNIQELVLQEFIDNDEYFTIDDMCKGFFVSKSKINKLLTDIKPIFDSFGLKIVTKPHYGMKLEGDELGKRMVIAAHLNEERYIGQFIIDAVESIVIDEIRKEEVIVSDVILKNIVFYIGIMINRIKKGKDICLHPDIEMQDTLDYRLTRSILAKIESNLDITFSKDEVMYLFSFVMGQISANLEETPEDPKINVIIDGFLQKIEHVYDISLWNDQSLRDGLMLHLRPLVLRLKKDVHLKNPILDDIKQQFTFAFNLAVILAEEISLIYKKQLVDDDIAYLTMHICLALERNVQDVKQKYNRIAIICTTGKGTAQLLKYKIEQSFPKANNVVTFSLFNKEEVITFDPDIIFSTVPVEVESIPVEIISPLFSKSDEKKLIKYQVKKDTEMVINKYFSKDLFCSNLDSTALTQKEAISEMCQLVGKTGITPSNFEELCLKREELASTCFGNLIALVHPIELCSKITKVGVGIMKKPIDWDGLPVRIIFTIAQAKSNEARDLLLFIQNLVHNPDLIRKLSDVTDFEEFKDTLINGLYI
ncbi:BglG family transcription antiterminator [Robertmurraya sp. P23]|uniref:BglG family transcription antiterminator n=1 Tax=Robertmurraya sp. P23 TaxID=3436931 RepID=UPI003D992793